MLQGAKAVQLVGLHVRPGKRGDVYKFKMDLWRNKVWVRTVYKTIGRVDDTPLEHAQAEAAKLAGLIRRGVDPTRPEGKDPVTMTVLQLFEHYVEDLEARGKGKRNRDLIMARCKLHLKSWLNRPFVSITRAECRAAHKQISKQVDKGTGKRGSITGGREVADKVLSNFGTAWKVALQTLDGDIPTDIPSKAVRLNAEGPADYSDFSFEQMKADMARATPVMRAAVKFTLLSGLRKANVLGLQRDWIEKDRLVIPRANMKIKDPRRGPFVVPLSNEMRALRDERLSSSNEAFVFPLQRLYKAHALRHMHYTTAQSIGLPQPTIDLLHDHAFGGMGQTYGSRQHFDFANLLSAQNAVTMALLSKIG